MLVGESQPLGMDVEEPGCEQTRHDDQGRLNLGPQPEQADHLGKVMQGRPERGGSFESMETA
jgi:hypothetical protein